MTKCKKCKVFVEAGQPRCPLCFSAMEPRGSGDTAYPDYGAAYQGAKRFTLEKLFLFLSIATGAVCIAVNLLTLEYSGYWWSAIVAVSFVMGWSLYLSVSLKGVNMAGKILSLYVLTSITLLTIDICAGFLRWSTTYVIPFLTIAVVLCITFLAMRGKAKYKDYLGYLIAALLSSICPFLLFLFSLSAVLWTSVAALLYSLLTVIGMYIFSDMEFKTEVKKRFYF